MWWASARRPPCGAFGRPYFPVLRVEVRLRPFGFVCAWPDATLKLDHR